MKNEILEYLKFDCLSLFEIMNKFRNELINSAKIEIDIVDCYTSASLSKKLFFKNYYMKPYSFRCKNEPIFELTD